MAMTYSYSGDPSTSEKDAIRFWLSDTGPTTWYKSDQELNYVASLYPNALDAAAFVARSIAASFASKVNRRIGDLSISASDAAKQWLALAQDLDGKAALGIIAMPYAGGISVSDVQNVDDNSDRVRPPFREGQFDHPASDTSRADPNPTFIAGDWGP